ncbi:uncharacterized protein METZ01_LOCUS44759 [marine metagenome]|uniref:Secretion system C-terminal sorting domain-containing protein n=1 Tax=marine metagenome TaxID=408172 RepID=A0A381RJA5_9ZZZZ
MSNYFKNILILTLLFMGTVYGTTISSASIDIDQNTLTIQFTDEINTTSILLSRLSIDDDSGGSKPDIILEGGTILTSDSLSSSVIISLLYGSSIDEKRETIYGTPQDLEFWGINTAQLDNVEAMDLDALELIIDHGAFINASEVSVEADTLSCSVQTSGSGNPVIMYATYDANSNTAYFLFDRIVQFDQIAEDRSVDNGPGNGVLDPTIPNNDPGEDRNGNDVLDSEQNIIAFKIGFKDVENGSIMLEGLDQVIQTADHDTISIILTANDAKRLETSLDLNALSLNILSGAFRDTLYNPNPASDIIVSVIADSLPLFADSVYYDITQNDLQIYFRSTEELRRDVSISPAPVWGKISFSDGNDIFSLYGTSGSPLVKDGYKIWAKELLLGDQRKLEQMFNNLPESTTITSTLDGYSVYDELFNGNIPSENIPVVFYYGNSTNNYQPPRITPGDISYSALNNVLSFEWNINVGYFHTDIIASRNNATEFSELIGLGLFDPVTGDTLSLHSGVVYYHPNKKKTNILLSQEDQILLESFENRENLLFYVDDFSFYSASPFNNGCSALPLDSTYVVQYEADTLAPLITGMKFNLLDSTLSVALDKPTTIANINAASFAVLNGDENLNGTVEADSGAEFVSTFTIRLADESYANLESLPDSIKTDFLMVVASNSFANADGITNQQDTVSASYGRPFWIKSFEAFAPPPESKFSSVRYIGSKFDIYVDDAVWGSAMDTSTVNTFVYALENEAPQDSTKGILDLVTDYVGEIHDTNGDGKIIFTFTDILDEYGLGRNDTKSSLFIHGYINTADTSAGDLYSNMGDIIYLDVNPVSLNESDEDLNVLFHSTITELTKLAYLSNYPEQEIWIVSGISLMLQKLILGDVRFFGESTNPTITSGNQLTYIGSGIQVLKSREDQWNVYLFFSYLQEKFTANGTGWDIIQAIAVSPSIGINAVQDGLASLGFTNLIADVFANYGVACYLDLTQTDSLYGHAYSFAEFDLQTPPSGKPASVITWDQSAGKGAPYSFKDIAPWSYNYVIMRGYFLNLEGEVVELCPDLLPTDTLIFDGYDGISYRAKKIVLKSSFLMDVNPDYQVVDFSLNDDSYGYLPVTTDDNFAFKDTLDNPDDGVQILLLMIAKTDDAQAPPTYDCVISNILMEPAINGLYGYQNPGINNYLDLYVTSDRKIYDPYGVEGPQITGYSADDTMSITMPVLYNLDQGFEAYHANVLLENSGTYEFHYVGRDQSGNVFDEKTFAITVGISTSGSPLTINLLNSSLSIPSNSFGSEQIIMSSEQLTNEKSFPTQGGLALVSSAMFGPNDKLSNTSLNIVFDITQIEEDHNKLSIYQFFDGAWRHIGGDIFSNMIQTNTRSLGQFALVKGNHGPVYEKLTLPVNFSISQNYPNPFNPNTRIGFTIPKESQISISVYDILGRKVTDLENGYFSPGAYMTSWNGRNMVGNQVATGVYFYEIRSAGFNQVKKMILIK